jgi:hypothetical protein
MTRSEPSFLAKISGWWFTGPRVTEGEGQARANIRRWTAWSSAPAARGGELVPTLAAGELEIQQPMVAVFSGPVADIPIAELVQTIGMGRKDGVIVVRHEGRESRVWCLGGEVVDAESGQLSGDLAFYRILGIPTGYVHADFRTVPRMRIIHASIQALVLEAARRKDECDVLRRRLGSAHCVYSPATKPLAGARHGRAELGLLRAFHPGATLDEVLADSHLGDLEALRILVTLVEQEWLVPNHALTEQRATPSAAAGLLDGRASNTLQPYLAQGYAARPRRSNKGLVMLGPALVAALAGVALWRFRAPAADGPRALISSPALAEVPPTPLPPPSPLDSVATTATGAPTDFPNLLVEVETAPIEATVWLDGTPAGRGRLSLRLPRDGRTHEMRVSAPGYQTERVLFSDTPPPALVALAPTVSADAEPRAPESNAKEQRPMIAPRRLPGRLHRRAASGEENPAASARSLTAVAQIPSVQIIADEDPTISVLE